MEMKGGLESNCRGYWIEFKSVLKAIVGSLSGIQRGSLRQLKGFKWSL